MGWAYHPGPGHQLAGRRAGGVGFRNAIVSSLAFPCPDRMEVTKFYQMSKMCGLCTWPLFFFFFWEPLTFRCSGPFFAKTENVGRGQRSCDSEVELMNRSHTDDGEASQDAKMGARDLQLLLTLHSASCLSLLSSQITHLLGAREWGCLGGSEPRVHLLPLCLLAPFCSWLSAIGVKAGDNQEGDFPGPGSAEVGPIEG